MKRTYSAISAIVTVLFILVVLYNFSVMVRDARSYERGALQLENGEYAAAVKTFEKLGVYRDSTVLLDYARFKCNYDINSSSFVVCSYDTIQRIDNEYDGTRFETEIAQDRAMICDVYYSLANTEGMG